MSGQIKTNGAWHIATSAQVKVAGSWHKAARAFVKVAGVWHTWYASGVFDSFSRSNTTSGLGTSDSGQSWLSLIGNWIVNSTRAVSNDSVTSLSTVALAAIETNATDLTTTLDVQDGTGIAFWVSDAGSWWAAYTSQSTGTGGNTPYQVCDSGLASSAANPPAGNCCSTVSIVSTPGGTYCNAGQVNSSSIPSGCCSGYTSSSTTTHTYHAYDANCSNVCTYLGSAQTASQTYQCNQYPYLIQSGSTCQNYNNQYDTIPAVRACPPGYTQSGSLCAMCTTGSVGTANGCGSLYSCYNYGPVCTGCSPGSSPTGGQCDVATTTTTYSCYTQTTTTAPTTTYSCYTSNSTHYTPTYTTYVTDLVVVSSASGTVVSQASSEISNNSTGYTSVGSLSVKTSGNTATVSAYAGASNAGTAIKTATVTNSGTKGTKIGIIKGYSPGSQGTTVDNLTSSI